MWDLLCNVCTQVHVSLKMVWKQESLMCSTAHLNTYVLLEEKCDVIG